MLLCSSDGLIGILLGLNSGLIKWWILERGSKVLDWLINQSQPPSACQCDLFIQEGARLGRTPAEVVSMCDITFSCVSDPKAARDVSRPTGPLPAAVANYTRGKMKQDIAGETETLPLVQLVLGPSGVLQGIRPGKCYVEMSTVDPETITELSQVCKHTRNFQDVAKNPEMLIRSFTVRKSDPGAAASWRLRWQEASRSPTTGCWSSWPPATEQCTRTAAAVSRPWERPLSFWVRKSKPLSDTYRLAWGYGGTCKQHRHGSTLYKDFFFFFEFVLLGHVAKFENFNCQGP